MANLIFKGQSLSDMGFIEGHYNDSSETEIQLTGLTLNTIQTKNNNVNYLVDIEDDTPLEKDFSVFKHPCENAKYPSFTNDEISEFQKWVLSDKYEELLIEDDYEVTFYRGMFTTVTALLNGSRSVIGYKIHFVCDGSYGFGIESVHTFSLTKGSSYTLEVDSDKYGEINPTKLVITCKESGTLNLYNSLTKKYMVISNCSKDEQITIDSKYCIITSNNINHNEKIYNGFNFVFFRLYNTTKSSLNVISSSLNCDIEIRYKPIRRLGLIR